MQASNRGCRYPRSGLPRSLTRYMGMPSGPGALWRRALDRVDAISSSVTEGDEDFIVEY